MSHEKREWFVSIENEFAYKAVQDTVGFNIDTDFERDITVHQKISNGEAEMKKNLARISEESIWILQKHPRAKFKVYMRETPDSKITLWIGEIKSKKVEAKKASALPAV